jgi:hypothetical protein
MKESVATKMGGQLDRYIKMDTGYPGYVRVRVEYPIVKALIPSLTVKINGRGTTSILLRHENVPHFCFTCGCIGHAPLNCEEGEPEDDGIKFSEELRASPLRHIQEILVRQGATRVSRPLFQASGPRLEYSSDGSQARSASPVRGANQEAREGPEGHSSQVEGLKNMATYLV